MKLNLVLFFSLILFFSLEKSKAQCTLTNNDDTKAEVLTCLSNCNCSSIIVPNGVRITLSDKWDFSNESPLLGPLSITIEIGGQLIFSGNGKNRKDITLESGSILYVNDVSDPPSAGFDPIVNAGGNGQVRITIGGVSYNGNDFQTIIENGGVDENGPLPVELKSFTANTNEESVILSWSTASEQNNDYFTLERSKDGRDFEIIEKVNGQGTSTVTSDYSITDRSPYLGLSFYRLSQTDFDGAFEIFPAISVVFASNTNTFSISPNPIRNQSVTLKVSGRVKNEPLELKIIDLQGRLIETTKFWADPFGNLEAEIQLKKQLRQGTYIFELSAENYKEYLKVVRE